MKQFRSILTFLLIFAVCTCLIGCLEDDDDDSIEALWGPYYKFIEFRNETDENIIIDYISDIDEADWIWEKDEYVYDYKELAPYQSGLIEILITDYDEYDILTFTKGVYTTDIVGYWREAESIEVYFDDDLQEFEFSYHFD